MDLNLWGVMQDSIFPVSDNGLFDFVLKSVSSATVFAIWAHMLFDRIAVTDNEVCESGFNVTESDRVMFCC